MALSLPPLQQKRMGSDFVKKNSLSRRSCQVGAPAAAGAPTQKRLVSASEAIFEAEAVVTTQGGKADGVLVLLVKKIGDATRERNTASDEITGGDVEARVARVAREAQTVEVAVPARAGEVSIDVEVEAAISGIKPHVAGVHGPPQEMIARLSGGGSY